MTYHLSLAAYHRILAAHALWWTVPFVGCAIIHLEN